MKEYAYMTYPEVTSLADAVKEEINSLPHVKTTLSEGIVNYSALARKLLPFLKDRLSREVNEESAVVAIKRYADDLTVATPNNDFLTVFANAELTLQDNMVYTHLRKNDHVTSRLEKLFVSHDWKIGEMRILIQGADQVMLIAKKSRVDEVLHQLEDEKLFSIEGVSMLSFRMSRESYAVYGIIAEVARLMAQKAISIEMVTTPPDLHLLVYEKDAERAYSALKSLIRKSQQLLERSNGKKNKD